MDISEKKKYLRRYNAVSKRLLEVQTKFRNDFRDCYNSFANNNNPKPTNRNPKSSVEAQVFKILLEEQEYRKLKKEKKAVDNGLKELRPNEEEIIREVDINGFSLAYISKRSKKNYKYLINLHSKAMEKLNINI